MTHRGLGAVPIIEAARYHRQSITFSEIADEDFDA
jgi:hypothetical protein